MGKAIAIFNQKGGVGKTTTNINLAACLAIKGKKVLILDIDPQGNTTSGIGISKKNLEKTVYNILVDQNFDPREAIIQTTVENLDLIPASVDLAGAEVELVQMKGRAISLKKGLDKIRHMYDYIFIDCPPSLGLLTINSFTASDSILIPVQSEYYALEGLSQLLNTIKLVQKHFNRSLRIEGVLLTMFDARTNLGAQVNAEVQKYFGDRVYKTIIPRNVRLSEAPSHGLAIIDYDPKSRGAEVYSQLAEEVLEAHGK